MLSDQIIAGNLRNKCNEITESICVSIAILI